MYEKRLGIHCHKHISLVLPYHQRKYNPLHRIYFKLSLIFQDGENTNSFFHLNQKEKKAFRQWDGQRINVNGLRTEEEGSFCVSSFESINHILPKIQDECTAIVMRRWIVVQIDVWAVILKKEGGKWGQPHMEGKKSSIGGKHKDVQKSTQQC